MDSDRNLFPGLKIVDLAIMLACFMVAAFTALLVAGAEVDSARDFLAVRISIGNAVMFAAFAVLWYLLFCAFGLYDELLLSSMFRKAKDVLKATSIGTCLIVGLAVPFQISFIDTTFMLVFWSCTSLLTFCLRYTVRKLLVRNLGHAENLRRVLIVGVNTRAIKLARRLEASEEMGCQVIGFADDTAIHAMNFDSSGYSLVCNLANLAAYLGNTAVDEVMICLPVQSRADAIKAVIAMCEEQGIAYGILRDLFKLDLSRSTMRQLNEQFVITIHPHAISSGQAAIKRVLDIGLSSLLIVLLAPIILVTALLVKLTSPGPVIFSQDRVGLNKSRIRVFKFRTMVVDAEQLQAEIEHLNEASGPVFKIKSDPRITPIGAFLRKTSIDELPQLFNVLRGEMSLVGPRPLPLRDYQGFDKDWHRRRVSVRPGITGLWQVSGRDQSSFDDWVKQDLEYIDHWSLGLDTKIILKTIPAVLRGDGAV